MSRRHFIPASTTRVEEISAPGKGVSIAPACGGSVESQIERSTYLIAQRLGCSPQAIQRLAGIAPTSTNNAALNSMMTTMHRQNNNPATSPNQYSRNNNNNSHFHQKSSPRGTSKKSSSKMDFDDPSLVHSSGAGKKNNGGGGSKGSPSHSSSNPMIASVKKEIDEIKPMSLPPLPSQFQSQGSRQAQQNLEKNHKEQQQGYGKGSGGLTIAQQQAAFLDDAEAARQFAAQLRYRDAMLQQRKGPCVGQYNVPSIIGADNQNAANFYSRAPHVSLDGQTPRSSRFMFNIDLFENGTKRPGPGTYNVTTVSSARNGGTIGGRDRGTRTRLPMERLNARAPVDVKEMKKKQKSAATNGI